MKPYYSDGVSSWQVPVSFIQKNKYEMIFYLFLEAKSLFFSFNMLISLSLAAS